jgi:hypothetical protein
MSGLIVVCARPDADLPCSIDHLRRCAARLTPDNITPHAPLFYEDPRLMVAVVNPLPDLPHEPGAVCTGALVGGGDGWTTPGSPRPDGTYAAVRWDADRLELLSDNLASRTLWYVLQDDLLIASTSQRALVCLLGDLRLNDEAVAWLASSGTLGPGNGWDTRLRQLPAATVLSLDRRAWTSHLREESTEHRPESLPADVHLGRWRDAILETCAELDVSLDDWLLPLSGGLDSRVLLAAFVAGGRRPRCVTWGVRRSLDDPDNDSAIARRLAEYYGVEHAFLPTDAAPEPARDVIQRYLVAGEGRTDQIAGYLDGLAIWKRFFEEGVTGVIRGDEPGWGYDKVHSAADALRGNRVELISDFPATHLIRQLGLAPQSLPDWMRQRPGESLILYDGRLTDSYQVPLDLGPLNDVKCAYVEVANPFFGDRAMRVTRALPEHLRRERHGFDAVVAELGPPIPEAKRSALAGLMPTLRSRPFITEMIAELTSGEAERVCERRALDLVVDRLRRPGAPSVGHRLRHAARTLFPRHVRAAVRPDPKASVATERLAFRLVLASRMATLLTADAAALREPGARPGA